MKQSRDMQKYHRDMDGRIFWETKQYKIINWNNNDSIVPKTRQQQIIK